MRRTLMATLALLAAPTLASADMITMTPEQLGEIFCIARLGNDMAPVEKGLLTEDLSKAILFAEVQNIAYEAEHPGDKPPLGDGIPWQTYPDYASVCTVGDVVYMMDEAELRISYGFPDNPRADFPDWLALKLVEDPVMGVKRWRIDDVIYAEYSTLREALVNVFME